MMRVTLTIDDDIHTAAKAIAHSEGVTLGQVITEMMRVGLRDAHRRHPELLTISAHKTLKSSNDLGKRIQARFRSLGPFPATPRRSIRQANLG